MPFPQFRLADNFIIDTADDRVQKQGLRIALIGESGSGKSWTMAILAEQAIEQGLQVMFIDPHGEYHTFAERFPGVIIIGGENADLPLVEEAIDIYAQAYRQGKILDFSLKEIFTDEELYGRMVERILRALWKVQVSEARPAIWILEEAHLECPQEKSADVMRRVGLVKGIATGGRKFGVLLILGTQRPAELHKTPLSQCWLRVFGKLTEKLDRDAVKDYMKPLNPDALKSLVTGEFFVYGLGPEPFKTTITSERLTRHGAETPLIAPIERVETAERASIEELREMVEKTLKQKAEEQSEITRLKGDLTKANKSIEQLREKANIADVLREAAAAMASGSPQAAAIPSETLARLEELEKREGEVQGLQDQVKDYAERVGILEGQLDGYRQLQEGLESLRRGLADLELFPQGAGASVDIDAIAAEVAKKMPAGQGYALLEPKEFILKDYQRREVDRLLGAVSKLSNEQKDLLRFMAGVVRVERREAARAVFGHSVGSFQNRSWSDKWNKERLFPLVDIGAVTWDQKHGMINYCLRETIERRLEVYKPSPQEVEQVVAMVAAEFARSVKQ